jgi:cytochrome c-type biogenesis protein
LGQGALSSLSGDGLASQFGIGLVLGLVWSPCVGPTLGAATTLAAQGRHLGQIALLMMVFGLGAGVPLVLLGGASRASLLWSRRLLASLGGYRRPRSVWSLSCWKSLFFWGMTAM